MSVVAKPVYSREPICTDHRESERERESGKNKIKQGNKNGIEQQLLVDGVENTTMLNK